MIEEEEGQERRRRGEMLCLDLHLRLRGGRDHHTGDSKVLVLSALLSLPRLPWGLERIQKVPTVPLLL